MICAGYYLAFISLAVPMGFASGFLQYDPVQESPTTILLLATLLLLRPALVEELIFRVLLLPRDPQSLTRIRLLALCSGALIAYIASHVLNGLLVHREAIEVFTNPRFLIMAAMLGVVCTAAYLKTRSVWPGVAAHWLTVTTWILLLGGYRLVVPHD